MGIYIPKLKIPKEGTVITIVITSDGKAKSLYPGDFSEETTEVKEPHGRLIDADLLLKFEHSICFGEDDEKPSNVIFADIVRRFPPTIEREDE